MPPEVAYVYRAGPPRLRPVGGGVDIFLDTSADGFQLGITQPDATNTGTTGALANYAGTFTPTPNTEATPYRNLLISSMVDFPATGDYWFDNCAFRPGVATGTARGVLGGNANPDAVIHLKRCTIRPQVVVSPDGLQVSNQLTGVYARNFIAERCDVSGLTDGFATYGTGKVRGCYIHDLAYRAASYQSDGVTHNDGFQVFGGDGSEWVGNFSDMRPDAAFSDRSAPASSSTGGIGQHIAITPTVAVITNFLADRFWMDYGFRGIGGAASATPSHNGGSITITNGRFGPNIASFPVSGSGSARRPIIVNEAQNLIGLPATGLGVPDTTNGNVNYDGTPTLVYRQTP